MKKILLSIVIAVSFLSFSNVNITGSNNYRPNLTTDSAYICVSSTAYAYHSRLNCKGLVRCTHDIIKVSVYDAVHKYGRKACKICE